MRALLFALLAAGCASGPNVNVTVMRVGPLYPALAENCPLEFVNAQHIEIALSGFEHLGLISFSGPQTEIDKAAKGIPAAVAAGACKMGGTSVSLNAAIGGENVGIIQFSIWRKSAPTPPAQPTATPAKSI
jgi:hypothetical protein